MNPRLFYENNFLTVLANDNGIFNCESVALLSMGF